MEDIATKIKQYLYSNPNLLLSLPYGEAVGRKFLPYSLGFEFECHQSDIYKTKIFQDIPNIMEVSVDGSEQRYRIPPGLNGLICLFDISNNLKQYSLLNSKSGIHIHVDFTDSFHLITNSFIQEIEEWLLSELDKYGELPEGYNKRGVEMNRKGNWVNVTSKFKTFEFRVFQQTFEYAQLLEYAIHLCELAIEIKTKLGVTHISYDNRELTRMQQLLFEIQNTEIKSFDQPMTSLQQARETIKKRVIKWN